MEIEFKCPFCPESVAAEDAVHILVLVTDELAPNLWAHPACLLRVLDGASRDELAGIMEEAG